MYKRRIIIFLATVGLALAGLAVRLGYLQLVQGSHYVEQAQLYLQDVQLTPPARGQIRDRTGRILAMDEPCYGLVLDYRFIVADLAWKAQQTREIARKKGISRDEAAAEFDRLVRQTWQLAAELAGQHGQNLPLAAQAVVERVQAVREVVGRPVAEQRQSHAVVTGLDETTRLEVERRLGETVGAAVRPGFRRRYPWNDIACHVIGVTGQVSEAELTRQNAARTIFELKRHVAAELNILAAGVEGASDGDGREALDRLLGNSVAGDIIGKGGVEKMCDGFLRGRRGYRRVRRGDSGVEVTAEQPSQGGGDVVLTLDIELQRELTELMRSRGETGSIIVLDVPRGEVLAMVSLPTYDLNTYGRELSRLGIDRENFPLYNRCVSWRYPPGSTVKPLSALAALASGAYGVHDTIECRGYLTTPDVPPRCWIYLQFGGSHGPQDVIDAVKNSCNIYFYVVGRRLGLDRLAQFFGQFGFGERPGTGLREEIAGLVPDSSTAVDADSEAMFMAIGQGNIEVTPMHVANAIATIARGGAWLSPQLAISGGQQQQRRELNLAGEHVQAVREGMYRVVNAADGSAARMWRTQGPLPVKICGKTGTADTHDLWVDLNGNGRKDPEEVLRSGNTAWFVGWAPHDRPRIAFAVTVEYVDSSGARSAGPIAHEVVRIWSQDKYAHLH